MTSKSPAGADSQQAGVSVTLGRVSFTPQRNTDPLPFSPLSLSLHVPQPYVNEFSDATGCGDKRK